MKEVHDTLDGHLIARSSDVIRVDEDGAPPRYYFPRDAVYVDQLDTSATTNSCPYKGQATHYHVTHAGRQLRDAIWSYEAPYDEHAVLKERKAFYDSRHASFWCRRDGRRQPSTFERGGAGRSLEQLRLCR